MVRFEIQANLVGLGMREWAGNRTGMSLGMRDWVKIGLEMRLDAVESLSNGLLTPTTDYFNL